MRVTISQREEPGTPEMTPHDSYSVGIGKPPHFKSQRSVSALNIGRHPHLHYRLILQSTVAMRGNAQPLMVTTFPTYWQKLLYIIQSSTHHVMSFNTATMELVPHYWYVTIALTMYQSCIVSKGPSTSVHADTHCRGQ